MPQGGSVLVTLRIRRLHFAFGLLSLSATFRFLSLERRVHLAVQFMYNSCGPCVFVVYKYVQVMCFGMCAIYTRVQVIVSA